MPRLSILAIAVAAALAIAPVAPARAEQIAFNRGWTEQTFNLFGRGNNYVFRRDALDIASAGTVSLVWTALPESVWDARSAAWRWQVDASVPATDLRRGDGDDRNLAVYFVFLPAEDTASVRDAGIRSLLTNDEARVLVYVWGGAHDRGAMLASPHLGERGRTVVLRPSGTGVAEERVNLTADYERAFGGRAPSVVGLAVSADSDDTRSVVRARVADLRLE